MTCRASINPLSSAARITFIEPARPATCVPTFGRNDLEPGQAWCLRGQHAMTLRDFLAAKPCPGRPA